MTFVILSNLSHVIQYVHCIKISVNYSKNFFTSTPTTLAHRFHYKTHNKETVATRLPYTTVLGVVVGAVALLAATLFVLIT